MKHLQLSISMLLIPFALSAQVKGNKNIETKTFPLKDVRSITVGLYADIFIDASADNEEIKITTDENLIDLIDFEVVEGKMKLQQKKWISPSQDITIGISAPNLERLEQSTHDKTFLNRLSTDEFKVLATIGEVEMDGSVGTLYLSGETGWIDASKVKSRTVEVKMWDEGKFLIGPAEQIVGEVKSGKLIYQNSDTEIKVATPSGGEVWTAKENVPQPNVVKFISFKIKNNSGKRIDCYVKGPNSEGKKFSYGFPMRAGEVRKEDWSIGTKVYQVNNVGTRKLLREISPNDDGQVVMLFD